MKLLTLLAGLLLSATTALSCTDPNTFVTETRNLDKFDKITVAAPVEVNITCGQKQALTITSDDKSIARVITEVIDGELIIKVDDHHKRISTKTKIDICVESLNSLRASGACDVNIPQYTFCEDFELRVSGASDVLIGNLEVKGSLNAQISGASDLDIIFKAGKSIFQVSGASDVDIDHIDAEEIEVIASGASDVDIRGKVDNLIINASGASEINLRHLTFNNREIHSSGASDVDF